LQSDKEPKEDDNDFSLVKNIKQETGMHNNFCFIGKENDESKDNQRTKCMIL